MTKPIEWRGPTQTVPGELLRLRTMYEGENGYDYRDATPADLVAALAAMPLGDRETVLSASWNGIVMRGDYEHVVKERDEARATAEACRAETRRADAAWAAEERLHKEATARAEKAERERDRMAAEFGCCPGEIPDDGEIARVVRERAEFRDRAEKAERERDEARRELDRVRASLDVVRHDLDGTRQELREAREDRDSLRTRLIAAESAAAAREPEAQEIERLTKALDSCTATLAEMTAFKAREMIDGLTALRDGALQPCEYPLSEGSRIQGETLVTAGGVRMSIRGQVTHCRGPSLDVELKCRERYWLPLRDVLALAHRRGLL